MTEAGYCRVLLDIKDTKITELESEITKLRIEYEKQIVKLQEENAELKQFIKDLIYENSNRCFQFSNTTCLFNSDYRHRAEELIGERL